VRLCDVIDKPLDQYCLPDTSTAEETGLATTAVKSKEVHDFYTSTLAVVVWLMKARRLARTDLFMVLHAQQSPIVLERQ
jgi:hypothetical protein